MKKLVSYLLVLIMMLSLAACGSDSKKASDKETTVTKTDADAVEVLESAIDNIAKIKGCEASMDLAIDAEAEGETVKLDGTVKLEANNIGADDMEIKIPVKASIPEMGDVEINLYLVDGFLYMDMMGQKMKLELDLSEITGAMDSMPGNVGDETTDEEAEKVKDAFGLEIKEKGGKYVLSADLNWDKCIELMGEEVPAEELKAINMKKFNMTATVTKDGVLDECTLDIAMDMDIEGVKGSVTVKGDAQFKTDDVKIDFPDFSDYVDASGMMEF